MQKETLIPVNEFCTNYNIEISFIKSLQQTELIEFTSLEETLFIRPGQLPLLEKLVRFHYELDINLEGIETIHHLLTRINSLQDEITSLKNQLRLYDKYE